MMVAYQITDAVLCLSCFVMTVIIYDRDFRCAWFPYRVPPIILACFFFTQAMWLLGLYIPGASGFPWPRLGLDGSLALMGLICVFNPLRIRQTRAHKRRTGLIA